MRKEEKEIVDALKKFYANNPKKLMKVAKSMYDSGDLTDEGYTAITKRLDKTRAKTVASSSMGCESTSQAHSGGCSVGCNVPIKTANVRGCDAPSSGCDAPARYNTSSGCGYSSGSHC